MASQTSSRLAGACLAFAFLLGATGCAGQGAAAESGTRYVAGDGSTVLLAPAERVAAPEIAGTTLNGQQWSLAAQRGQVVVMNVWASWCAPCRAEAPTLERTFVARQPDGVTFVGLDVRDSPTAAKAFVAKYAITYPNLSDADGQLQLQFHDTLPPQSIPSTVFIDKQGRVAARILGAVDSVRLNGIIDDLVKEPA